jgi:hypothetical protein
MSFMQPVMTHLMEWVEVETDSGTWFVPNDEVGLTEEDVAAITARFEGPPTEDGDGDEIPPQLRDFVEGRRLMGDGVRLVVGYGVRSSAPGYMDCTDWSVHKTLEEAEEAFAEEARECGLEEEDEE